MNTRVQQYEYHNYKNQNIKMNNQTNQTSQIFVHIWNVDSGGSSDVVSYMFNNYNKVSEFFDKQSKLYPIMSENSLIKCCEYEDENEFENDWNSDKLDKLIEQHKTICIKYGCNNVATNNKKAIWIEGLCKRPRGIILDVVEPNKFNDDGIILQSSFFASPPVGGHHY